MTRPSVQVMASWDQTHLQGTLTLTVPDGEPGLGRAGANLGERFLSLDELRPWLEALASYREDVASGYDLRVGAFAVQLQVWDPLSGSHCILPGLRSDPEGTTFAECFTCSSVQHGEQELCGQGQERRLLTGPPEALRHLAGALRVGR